MRKWTRTNYVQKDCKHCGNSFNASRIDACYCSPICSSRARPKRQPYPPAYHKARRVLRLNKLGYRQRINHQANERATGIRRWLDAYKLSVGCVDCGYNAHHSALHFDHVRGRKIFNVCNSKSIAAAKIEIEKCEVRCANCHAVKTWKFHPVKPDIFEATYEKV